MRAGWRICCARDGACFTPVRALRDLLDFTRRRKQVIAAPPEDANVRSGHVLSDVFGLSGQVMLEGLVEGRTDRVEIAQLAKGNARPKRPSKAIRRVPLIGS